MSSFITAVTYELIWPNTVGTTYLIGPALGLKHISLDGTGVPGVNRKFSPYASDGGYDDGFQLATRRMIWKLNISAETEAEFDTVRALVFTVFRPLQNPYKLKVTRADGAVRQIDCFVDGSIDIALGNGFTAIVTVPLVAPDPLWYDPTQVIATFNTFPATSFTINYAGTWYEWPIIRIDGQLADLYMINTIGTSVPFGTRQGELDMRPSGIVFGEYYIFDTRPAQKTVVDSSGANVLNVALPTFNRFPEFRLWPEPWNVGGSNVITVSHGTAGAGASVEFQYYNRYIAL
jgi:hypothetical protein